MYKCHIYVATAQDNSEPTCLLSFEFSTRDRVICSSLRCISCISFRYPSNSQHNLIMADCPQQQMMLISLVHSLKALAFHAHCPV